MQINLILDTERKRERLTEMRRRRVALKLGFGGGCCEGGGCRRHDVKIKQKWESENPNFLTLHSTGWGAIARDKEAASPDPATVYLLQPYKVAAKTENHRHHRIRVEGKRGKLKKIVHASYH
ncbi:hypothetical protein QL285_038275 [Trifolium repens]|nr:hypothetical protein QL285_038275 [Trifolium repens]